MADILYPDFYTKDRSYTRGGGIDDLNVFARTMGRATFPVPPPDFNRDTAPSEMPYHAPSEDPA
jgi:hypothetical protein